MNLLNNAYGLNTQPAMLQNSYPNFYAPALLSNPQLQQQQSLAPTVIDPLGNIYDGGGASGDDGADNSTGSQTDVSSMTATEAQQGLDQMNMPGIQAMQAVPGFGGLMNIAKAALSDQVSKTAHSSVADGKTPATQSIDASNPEGVAGSGGTGNGAGAGVGHGGEEFGGYGGGDMGGVASGGSVGYAADNFIEGNPSPTTPDGMPRDNVMMKMNTEEGVLPPDVMKFIGIDGLEKLIASVRQQSQASNAQQDQVASLLG